MLNFNLVGKISPKDSLSIKKSKIGLGFEKLDRNVFDPEKCYDFVAKTGVKKARLQSGWQRTEQQKGVYDFEWLDKVVDNMIKIGVEPWLCLCYGNKLYTPAAAEVFGAVGCPPIATKEERDAWANYVKATVTHFKGRVNIFEVWNEPDGDWCWKHGTNPTELGNFIAATAKACKEANPDCQTVGLVTCKEDEVFLKGVADTGCLKYLDSISYHAYSVNLSSLKRRTAMYERYRAKFAPHVTLIQGESGTQSREDGNGALHTMPWTPEKQAKYLLMHLLYDISVDVEFTSYFSCMDMIEALRGKTGDVSSYLDYGYFGVLGAEFDENGYSTGEYLPKPSYYALQNLCSVFCEDYSVTKDVLVYDSPLFRRVYNAPDDSFNDTYNFCVKKPNGSQAVVFWFPESIVRNSCDTTVSIKYDGEKITDTPRIVDLLSGNIYEFTEENCHLGEDGYIHLDHIPAHEYPLLLTFGDFV